MKCGFSRGRNFVSRAFLPSRAASWLLALTFWLAGPCIARASAGFVSVPGLASDVGVGADGSVWVTAPSGAIYKYDGAEFNPIPGIASRVAVDPNGDAWVVNSGGLIYRYTGNGFVNVPGVAADVGVGADGTVWVTNPAGLIYRYNGTTFQNIPGLASRIAVDPRGNAWVVNSGGLIYRYTGSSFVNVPGIASDIGVGADGTVWVTNPAGLIYRYNGNSFVAVPGLAKQISVGPMGQAWVVNNTGIIYQYEPGEIYYVDSVGGSDSNAGTMQSQPWQTIAKVNSIESSLKPGDCVLFKGGDTWEEQLNLSGVIGTVQNPITFGRYGTGYPVIDGGSTRSYGINATYPLHANAYVTVIGFEVRNSTMAGIVFANGHQPGITLENNYVHNVGAGAYAGYNGVPYDDATYSNALSFIDSNFQSDGTKILNNVVKYTGGHNAVMIHGDGGSPEIGFNQVGPGCVHNCIDTKAVVNEVIHDNTVYCAPATYPINGQTAASCSGNGFYTENTQIASESVTYQQNVAFGEAPGYAAFAWESGGACRSGASPCAINVAYYNNTAYGAAFGVYAASCDQSPQSVAIQNNIFDGGQIKIYSGCDISWDYNDDGGALGLVAMSGVSPGAHDLQNVNPLYMNPSSFDMHLQATSPVLNAGDDLVPGVTWMGALGE